MRMQLETMRVKSDDTKGAKEVSIKLSRALKRKASVFGR
jgi:hypothetical protein